MQHDIKHFSGPLLKLLYCPCGLNYIASRKDWNLSTSVRDLNNISNQFPVAFGWIFLKRGKNSSWKCQVNLILRWIILCLACKVQYFQEHMWRFRQFWCSLKCTSFFINTNEFCLFLSQDVLYLLWLRRFRNFFFLN